VNSNKWAWLQLGLYHMKYGDVKAAISSLQAALLRDPKDGCARSTHFARLPHTV